MEKEKSAKDMIFGTRPVIEALRSGADVEKILVQNSSRSTQMNALMREAKQHEVPVQMVPIEKLNRLTGKNHQGVVAFVSQVSYQKLSAVVPMIFEAGMLPFFVVLDKITDVRNFGAIARTAESVGVHALVLPSRGSAMINADAVKTSAGALHRINVARENNLKETLRFLKDSGVKLVAITEKAAVNLWSADLSGPIALIMGSEETGISEEYLKLADVRIKIPMMGSIESLNVSVATGIACYEVLRQREATLANEAT